MDEKAFSLETSSGAKDGEVVIAVKGPLTLLRVARVNQVLSIFPSLAAAQA